MVYQKVVCVRRRNGSPEIVVESKAGLADRVSQTVRSWLYGRTLEDDMKDLLGYNKFRLNGDIKEKLNVRFNPLSALALAGAA